MIALLVMTDGRPHIEEAIASFEAKATGLVVRRIIHDDSGDQTHRRKLAELYPHFEVIGHGKRVGFGASIARAWEYLRGLPVRYVFHLEDDFVFNRPLHLEKMARVLGREPKLVQLALRRQPWNDEEIAASGVVEQHPADYEDRETNDCPWLAHRRFFTTNPSLYRRDLVMLDWPQEPRSEGIFTHRLLSDPEIRFGFWGSRDSGEWVTHIGRQRVGTGY